MLHNVATRKYSTLEGHSKTVSRIVFSNDGGHLVSASYDKTIKIWDTKLASLVHTFEQRVDTQTNEEGNVHTTTHIGHKADIISMVQGKGDLGNLIISGDNDK